MPLLCSTWLFHCEQTPSIWIGKLISCRKSPRDFNRKKQKARLHMCQTAFGKNSAFPQRKMALVPFYAFPVFHKRCKTCTITSVGRSTVIPEALARLPH